MSEPVSAEPRDHELAAVVIRFVAAVVALLLAIAVVSVATRADDDDAPVAVRDGDVRGGAPGDGTRVASYIAARTGVLDAFGALDGRQAAVVSFTRYLTVDEAMSWPGREVVVELVLVAAPGGAPAAVAPGELVAWADRERAAAAEEAAALERLLPTTEDPAFVEQYRADIERLRALEGALDVEGEIVFGVVVNAPVATLRTLARRHDTRLVDPTGTPSAPRAADVRGIRPEETVVGQPRERPHR